MAQVPHTEVVDAAKADRLWAARRGLFFKPVAGFGRGAAYRGDKLTKRVWQEILAGDHVAQALLAPGEHIVSAGLDAPPRHRTGRSLQPGMPHRCPCRCLCAHHPHA